MLLELDGLNENAVLKKYTWGLDLAGSVGQSSALPAALQGAGGIGGLLAMEGIQDPNDPNDNLARAASGVPAGRLDAGYGAPALQNARNEHSYADPSILAPIRVAGYITV
jgi:hypothetical protein